MKVTSSGQDASLAFHKYPSDAREAAVWIQFKMSNIVYFCAETISTFRFRKVVNKIQLFEMKIELG